MKGMLFTSAMIASFSLSTAFADNAAIYEKAYSEYYQNATIYCAYPSSFEGIKPVVLEKQGFNKATKTVSATFNIGDDKLEIRILPGGSRGVVDYRVSGVPFKGTLGKYNDILMNFSDLSVEAQKVRERVNLSQMNCDFKVGLADYTVITDDNLHINVHPHRTYDLDGENVQGAIDVFKQDSSHLILLDDSVKNLIKSQKMNYNEFLEKGAFSTRKNFFRYNLPGSNKEGVSLELPSDAQVHVSQAGHSRYVLGNTNQTITFSGGNHNFCMLNNATRILDAFFENIYADTIQFNYPTNAIVNQLKTDSVIGKALTIPRHVFKKSNLLENILNNMSSDEKETYLNGYVEYFERRFKSVQKSKLHYFKTLTIVQRGIDGHDSERVIQGLAGENGRELRILLNYIHNE